MWVHVSKSECVASERGSNQQSKKQTCQRLISPLTFHGTTIKKTTWECTFHRTIKKQNMWEYTFHRIIIKKKYDDDSPYHWNVWETLGETLKFISEDSVFQSMYSCRGLVCFDFHYYSLYELKWVFHCLWRTMVSSTTTAMLKMLSGMGPHSFPS